MDCPFKTFSIKYEAGLKGQALEVFPEGITEVCTRTDNTTAN